MTSASKEPLSVLAAVRQAPFTAIESPGSSSEAIPALTRTRAPPSPASTLTTFPSSPTMPVNISRSPLPQAGRDEEVLADLLVARRQRPDPLGDPVRPLALQQCPGVGGADEERRDEHPHDIDLAGVEHRAREGWPALHQEVLDLPAAQLIEGGAEALLRGPARSH